MTVILLSIFIMLVSILFIVFEIKRVSSDELRLISKRISIGNIILLSICTVFITITLCIIGMQYLEYLIYLTLI